MTPASPWDAAPIRLDLDAALRQALERLLPLLDARIDLVTRTPARIPAVLADPAQLEREIVTRVLRGASMMPDGGRILLDIAEVTLTPPMADGGQLDPGPYVQLDLVVEGTGAITAPAPPLLLPLAPPAPPPRPAPSSGGVAAAASASRGTETVLVAEDEPMIASLIQRFLAPLGYDVVITSGIREAMSVEAQLGRPIQLLVTDVVMPGGSGIELAEQLRARHPGLAVLFISGFTDDVLEPDDANRDQVAFLPKPFSPEGLAAAVRSLLDRTSRGP